MNIESSTIKENQKNYKVQEEDLSIDVSKEAVEEVLTRVPGVEKEEVIFLIATVENSRLIEAKSESARNHKMEVSTIVKGLVNLLQEYEPQNLIEILEQIKYYEIERVFNSVKAAEELQEVL